MVIPKKFQNVGWLTYIPNIGDKGQYSDKKGLRVGDVRPLLMNVNLFENDTKNAVWGKHRIIKIIYDGFYESERIA